MTTHNINIVVSSKGTVTVKKELEDIGTSGRDAAGGVDFLKTALTALVSVQTIRSVVGMADAWSDMQSRVGAAVKDMEAAPELMQRMVDIANASYSPLDKTVEVYSRNVAVLRDLGHNAQTAADFTEALNHAMVTTATKGQDADVVINALSRAISTGKLRAIEFETIMSRSPRVLEAVAAQLDTTTTNLISMAKEGKVTGDVIVKGLVGSLEKLRNEANAMPATVGDAIVRIQTNFTALIGTLDQATGASGALAGALIWVADNLEIVLWALSPLAAALTVLAVQIIGTLVVNAFMGMTSAIIAAAKAFASLTALIMANPIVAAITLITVGVVALVQATIGWEVVIQRVIEMWGALVEIIGRVTDELGWTRELADKGIEIRMNAKQAVEDLKNSAEEIGKKIGLGMQGGVETGSKNGAAMMKSGIEAGASNASQNLIAKYEELNGKVIKPLGNTLIEGGKYIHNEVTGAVSKASGNLNESIQHGGQAAGSAIESAMTSGGEAAAGAFEAAGIRLSGWLVEFFVDKLDHIMSRQLRLIQAEEAKMMADADKSRAEAEAIRSGRGANSGSSSYGGSSSLGTRGGNTFVGGVTGGDGGRMPTKDDPLIYNKTEIKNIIDPSGMVDVLDTDAGQKQVVNVIKLMREEVRDALGVV